MEKAENNKARFHTSRKEAIAEKEDQGNKL
jgi:hypothetical protein